MESMNDSYTREWAQSAAPVYVRKPITAEIRVVVTRADAASGRELALWSGKVESTGFVRDLGKLAPYLLEELLAEFPQGSSKPVSRILKIKSRDFNRSLD